MSPATAREIPPAEMLGRPLQVVIEVPRGSFVKRRPDGSIDFISPFPSPFNYGSVPGTTAPDGDPMDAVVLGARLGRGRVVEGRVAAIVAFVDAGAADPKLICVPGSRLRALRSSERAAVVAFFRLYAGLKRLLNAARRLPGETRFETIRVA